MQPFILSLILATFAQFGVGQANASDGLLSLTAYKNLYNYSGNPIESFSNERPPCTTKNSRMQGLSGAAQERLRWRKGFNAQIDSSVFNDEEQNVIISALQELQKNLCIKFGLWKPDANPTGDYAFYSRENDGCWSLIGRQGGRQPLNLGQNCVQKHIVMHETIHALGFDHEQCRPDRDNYITVLEENIEDEQKHNYDIARGSLTFNVPYDQLSLMHYHDHDFSKNGEPTMIAKNGKAVGDVGQLRPSDIKKLRAMYKCK